MQYMFTLNKNNHNIRSDNKILLPKCHTSNFDLKSFAYLEVYGINYQTVLELVSH